MQWLPSQSYPSAHSLTSRVDLLDVSLTAWTALCLLSRDTGGTPEQGKGSLFTVLLSPLSDTRVPNKMAGFLQ